MNYRKTFFADLAAFFIGPVMSFAPFFILLATEDVMDKTSSSSR